MSGVIRSRVHYQPHTDEISFVHDQPSEPLIYANNQELRKDNAYGDLSFGRQVASIPFAAWDRAIKAGYALNAKDPDIAQKEVFRFLKSEEGRKCMVRDKL